MPRPHQPATPPQHDVQDPADQPCRLNVARKAQPPPTHHPDMARKTPPPTDSPPPQPNTRQDPATPPQHGTQGPATTNPYHPDTAHKTPPPADSPPPRPNTRQDPATSRHIMQDPTDPPHCLNTAHKAAITNTPSRHGVQDRPATLPQHGTQGSHH
ncbi:hypothetical protein EDB83DRAFT_2319187 [Lactarius deliciosus]|nr:hypothetical protein EDB83DRAFT_2319187 [Lactarius deliciosus]